MAQESGTTVLTSLPLSAKTQSPKSFLYTSILKLYVGEQAAYIFSIILNHNRLSIAQIVKYSNLKASNVKKILVSLIQLNCLVYSKETNYLNTRTQFFYSINDEGCLKFIYANDIISYIKRDYDDLNATIVQNILTAGHLTVQDYLKSFDKKSEVIEIEKAFSVLAREKWLIPVNEYDFQNKFDLFNGIYKKQTVQFNSENQNKVISQSKRLQLVKEETRERYLKLINSDEPTSLLFKSESNDAMFQKVNSTLPLTFNFERFIKRLRSLHLATEAKHKIGEISSKIYALALNRIETKSRSASTKEAQLERYLANVGTTTVGLDPTVDHDLKSRLELKDQERGLNISVNDIYKELKANGHKFQITEHVLIGTILDPSVDMQKKRKKSDDVSRASKKVKLEVMDSFTNQESNEEEIGSDSDKDSITHNDSSNGIPDSRVLSLIMHHLKLLAADPKIEFLVEGSVGQFYVPFTKISPIYAKRTFKQFVKTLFGPDSLRVINCIEQQRLIDEKSISKIVLLKESHVRSIIGRLQNFHLIETQEIPKTQDRSAMRAVYAFRFKYEVAATMFMNSLMFNMGEVLERLDDMKEDNRILLDKISREDVKGREHELLLTSELKQLQKFYQFEKMSLAKFNRLRSGVEVLRFFGQL